MRLPIDTTAMGFIAAGEPGPDVEFETGRPRTDKNGVQLFVLAVMAMGDGAAEVIKVKTAGEPKGISAGTPVRLVGLYAQAYTIGDRSGVAFRATGIEPLATASVGRTAEARDKS